MEEQELTENSSPRSSLVCHSSVSASSFGGEGRLNELSYDVSGTRYDILDLDDFEEERAEEERERKERGGMIVPTIAIHPYFHKNKQIYQAANAQTTTFEMTLNASSFFSSSSSSASVFANSTVTSLSTSSAASVKTSFDASEPCLSSITQTIPYPLSSSSLLSISRLHPCLCCLFLNSLTHQNARLLFITHPHTHPFTLMCSSPSLTLLFHPSFFCYADALLFEVEFFRQMLGRKEKEVNRKKMKNMNENEQMNERGRERGKRIEHEKY
ncbi:uncharacterized protein MONOS_14218 [Monocercomonoides exilis]|uniref:uncharacterized protein n=1 Tax=Monocercomonoides exilis TaxID=2049356 RepID=UPI00355987C3|nr:hypothetical protein MONOS_14218 [Monocercomonoides exilis]|eukprot:MONOS_14218.1-p1 / transcript=MONOS_14218.1 / gene=MONOS_14218 / organism=Monocercomonoides_exilis_PA203 / gene_product=unspecified product / transcript_product=unspecified product / location=Mono_scaffold00958:5512-6321(+) / protein_length=270 / sequence_SO=supercontig / SO=protein_coding / is_pseudo=false